MNCRPDVNDVDALKQTVLSLKDRVRELEDTTKTIQCCLRNQIEKERKQALRQTEGYGQLDEKRREINKRLNGILKKYRLEKPVVYC